MRWYWKDPFTLRLEQPGWKEFSLDNTAKLEEAYQSFHATGQKEVRVSHTYSHGPQHHTHHTHTPIHVVHTTHTYTRDTPHPSRTHNTSAC